MILFLIISLNELEIEVVVKMNATERIVHSIVKKLINDVKKEFLKLNLSNLNTNKIYLYN